MDYDSRTFGQNLHWLITVHGKGMREFARENSVHYSLLKKYTSGQVVPRYERVMCFASILGVSPGALLFDDLVPDVDWVYVKPEEIE